MSTNKIAEGILKNAMQDIKLGDMISMGFGASMFASSYNTSRQEGHGRAMSGISGFGSAAIASVVPMKVHMAAGVLKNAPKLAVTGYETMSQQARSMSMGLNQPFATSTFADNQQIYTMRQAGMSMAEKSKYNLQQSLMGNEAQHFHR